MIAQYSWFDLLFIPNSHSSGKLLSDTIYKSYIYLGMGEYAMPHVWCSGAGYQPFLIDASFSSDYRSSSNDSYK